MLQTMKRRARDKLKEGDGEDKNVSDYFEYQDLKWLIAKCYS